MFYVSIIESDTSHLEGYVSAILFCILFYKKLSAFVLVQVVVLVPRVMINFKQNHPTVNDFVQIMPLFLIDF